ncbi:MAG: tetratricopeptide repeat protein [bacterium]|nr:tetratricopeptide repeat protein [bacterium]
MGKIVHITDFLTRWSFILIAALMPIFVVPVQWTTIPQAKILFVSVLALIALVAWVVGRLAEGSVTIPKHVLLWGGALLPIVYVISAGVSNNVWSSLVSGNVAADTAVIISLWYILLALTALVFSKTSASMTDLLRAILIGFLVLALFQIARIVAPSFTSLGGYLTGNSSSIFGSWHDLGIVLGLGIFLVLALWDTHIAPGWWRVVLAVTGLASLFMLIVINSVDVWFALTALVLFYALLRWSMVWRTGTTLHLALLEKVVFIPILLAIFFAACGYWSATVYQYLPSQLQVVQLEVRPSWQGTYLVGQKALSSPRAFMLGSGPNTFDRTWGLFKPTGVNITDYWNTDFNAGVGFIPTTFVTTGALALLAWMVLVLGLLWSALRLLLRHGATPHGVLGAVVGGALYLMAFQIMYVPGIALTALLFVLIGMVVALEAHVVSRSPLSVDVHAGSIVGIAGAVIAVLTIVFLSLAPVTAARAIVSNLYIQRASFEYGATGNLDHSLVLVQKALTVFPENDLAHLAAVEIGLLQFSKIVGENKTDDAARTSLQENLQTTISHGLSAVSIDSADYHNWLSLAVLYKNLAGVGIEGAYANAKGAYERSINENPTNPLPHVQLAQLALAENDQATARSELDKAIALKPNLGAAYYVRSQIEVGVGNYPQAIDDASKATQFAPQDPVGWYNLGAVLYTAGSYDLASQALEQAMSLQNNYANAIFLLGLSLDKLGRREGALQAMQAVSTLNPNDESVQHILENLEAGKPALAPPPQKKNLKR